MRERADFVSASEPKSHSILRRFMCRLGQHEWSYVGERLEPTNNALAGYNRVCRRCGKKAWWV